MEKITVSFPGLGIEPFDLNKIAFTLFDKFEVRWYGVVITTGIFFAFLYAMWRGRRNEGIISDDVIDVGLMTVLLAWPRGAATALRVPLAKSMVSAACSGSAPFITFFFHSASSSLWKAGEGRVK